MISKGLKKIMAVGLSLAMVASVAPATPYLKSVNVTPVAYAADASPTPTVTTATSIGISFEGGMSMWVKRERDFSPGDVFYYQLTNDKGTNPTKYNPKKWTAVVVENGTYDDNWAYMDLSWLSTKKAQTMYVCLNTDENEETPSSVHIPAQSTKLKIDFSGTKPSSGTEGKDYVGNALTGYLVLNTGKTDEAITSFDQLEWRTANGTDWDPVSVYHEVTYKYDKNGKDYWVYKGYDTCLDLTHYVNKGVTLQFREAATNTKPAGKIVSVKYKAKANGPSVKIDNAKTTVTFPKDVEYCLARNYGTENENWTQVTAKEKKKFEALGYDGTETVNYVVRKAAKANSASSKLTVVTMKKATDRNASVAVQTSDKVFTTSEGSINVQFATQYDPSKGIAITNLTDYDYQVAVVKKSELKTISGVAICAYTNDGTPTDIKFTDVPTVKDKAKKTAKKITKIGADGKTKITTSTEWKDYTIIYRQYNKKSTAPGKICQVTTMPEKLSQTISCTCTSQASGFVYTGTNGAVTVASGGSTAGTAGTISVTVDTTNKIATSPKYAVAVYSDADCKTKSTVVDAKVSGTTLTITSKKNKTGVVFVKVTCEGAVAIIQVTVS